VGGNMKVSERLPAHIKGPVQTTTLDAHDKAGGDFSELRQPDGGPAVYLTPRGAKTFDNMKWMGFTMVSEKDTLMQQLFSGTVQHAAGNPNKKTVSGSSPD
jgi:hypothetical protein